MFNVGPPSEMLVQHETHIDAMCQCLLGYHLWVVTLHERVSSSCTWPPDYYVMTDANGDHDPENKGRWFNGILMLGQRPRRSKSTRQHRLNTSCNIGIWNSKFRRVKSQTDKSIVTPPFQEILNPPLDSGNHVGPQSPAWRLKSNDWVVKNWEKIGNVWQNTKRPSLKKHGRCITKYVNQLRKLICQP